MFINSDGTIVNESQILDIHGKNYHKMVTIKPCDIYKKLVKNIEQNINDMIIDGKRRGIGTIVRYNRFYENKSAALDRNAPPLLDIKDLALQLGIDTKLIELTEKK